MDRPDLSGDPGRQFGLLVFPLGVLLVFLVLAALYESLTLPLAIIMIVPMGLLAAMSGVWLTGGDNNVFTQIGLIVLVGLSAKNAILIVEFARELEFAGRTPVQAAIEASRLRLRPILMTSMAFIMGVLPLVLSTGAGAEMRRAMGVAVFSGMIGVTCFGLFLTPVFYVLLRKLTGNRPLTSHDGAVHDAAASQTSCSVIWRQTTSWKTGPRQLGIPTMRIDDDSVVDHQPSRYEGQGLGHPLHLRSLRAALRPSLPRPESCN